MGSQSRRPTRVPLLTARYNALRLSWALQHYHWTADDWKHVSGLTSLVSNCIGRMHVYEYGDNINNPSCLSTGDCSIWWSLCDGMERVQLP
ncbi:hypothetical protein AVEN_74361-1 [Araneus ventricosus]|uniref:Transposase Tc1-like domain-containing protein n=1 Tax=Araneus ventricosus TaxID=182803 RepID=A0A4Y2HXC1_ARAVE|nr:hypothetical protein AVEN_74361-1 [Araneus ventricosus]